MDSVQTWQARHPQKAQIRHEMWERLFENGAVETSPIGHIPNFIQAEAATALLESLPLWSQSQTIKCNPDQPQAPLRLAALKSGKTLYMAVPKLKQEHCFVELTAEIVLGAGMDLREAASARNALTVGRPIRFEEMAPIDLVIVGCVAVDHQGGRTGKGAGFADLELGLLQKFGLVNERTPLLTTVDELQVVSSALPMESHDWPLDWVITPREAIATHTAYPKPSGLDWSSIQADQWDSIPILKRLKKHEESFDWNLRPAKQSDAKQLLFGVNRVIGEQKYLGSAEPFTQESQAHNLNEVLANGFPMMVAESDQKIIGACDIIPYPELGFRHVGKLGMWVLPEYRGKGVGREILKSTLNQAQSVGLEKIELQVYSDNDAAIRLYKSVGFTQEGLRKRVRKLSNIYQDLINMGLFFESSTESLQSKKIAIQD